MHKAIRVLISFQFRSDGYDVVLACSAEVNRFILSSAAGTLLILNACKFTEHFILRDYARIWIASMSVLNEYLVPAYEKNMAECRVYSICSAVFCVWEWGWGWSGGWVSVQACLKRCCLWHVCFWCRWVGVTLKTLPASLTLSLSSTQICQNVLYLCFFCVCVFACMLKNPASESLLQSVLSREKYARARHVHKKKKNAHLTCSH